MSLDCLADRNNGDREEGLREFANMLVELAFDGPDASLRRLAIDAMLERLDPVIRKIDRDFIDPTTVRVIMMRESPPAVMVESKVVEP